MIFSYPVHIHLWFYFYNYNQNKLSHGSSGGDVAQFNLYLFDVRMFTNVVMSANPESSHVATGAKVTGSNSGATGFVHSVQNAILELTNVVGTFLTTDNLISTSSNESDGLVKDTSNNTLTVSSIIPKTSSALAFAIAALIKAF